MKLNAYSYEFNKATATISNEGRFWFLKVDCKEERTLIYLDSRVFNTRKGALKYVTELLTKYKLA